MQNVSEIASHLAVCKFSPEAWPVITIAPDTMILLSADLCLRIQLVSTAQEAHTMRRFFPKPVRLFCALILLISSAAIAQERTKTSGYSPSGDRLLALAQWRIAGRDGHLRCEVLQEAANLHSRVLTIYREDGNNLAKIFGFDTPDSILSVYPLGDYNGRLFTTWAGGSAYHFRVFAFVGGQVKQVLDEGSKLAPELTYDEQGRESVLISDPVIENGHWTAANGKTTVYKWDGQGYEKIGTVSWAKRLQCLSKGSCASLR